jgi:hypothetical protein
MGTWPSDLALSKAYTGTDYSPLLERLKLQVWVSWSKKRRRGRVNDRFRWKYIGLNVLIWVRNILERDSQKWKWKLAM